MGSHYIISYKDLFQKEIDRIVCEIGNNAKELYEILRPYGNYRLVYEYDIYDPEYEGFIFQFEKYKRTQQTVWGEINNDFTSHEKIYLQFEPHKSFYKESEKVYLVVSDRKLPMAKYPNVIAYGERNILESLVDTFQRYKLPYLYSHTTLENVEQFGNRTDVVKSEIDKFNEIKYSMKIERNEIESSMGTFWIEMLMENYNNVSSKYFDKINGGW